MHYRHVDRMKAFWWKKKKRNLIPFVCVCERGDVMNLNHGNSQIHILRINILSLSLSLKSEELNSGQGRGLTDWRSILPTIGVETGKQPLATSDLFEDRMPISQEAHVIRGSGKIESAKRKRRVCSAKSKVYFSGQLIWED